MFEELLSRLDGPLGCVFTVDGGQPISQKKRMFTRSQCYFVNARRLSGRESITKDGPTDGIICCVNTSAKFVLLMLSLCIPQLRASSATFAAGLRPIRVSIFFSPSLLLDVFIETLMND